MSDQEQYYLFSTEEIFIIIEQYIHVIIIDLWRYINITEYNL